MSSARRSVRSAVWSTFQVDREILPCRQHVHDGRAQIHGVGGLGCARDA
jgi:hypothetical protein